LKALVKTQKGKGFLELLDIPEPTIGDNEVLIEVKACGVCGTDLHILQDEFPYYPPVILGHEFAGVVKAVGVSVTDWKPGDRVVGEPHTCACGKCYLCRTGNPQICLAKRSPGWGIDGAFAPLMRFPDPHLLHNIPENIQFHEAALIEPLANVVTDIVLTQAIMPGDIVVVAGPGLIGIMAALIAKHIGAKHVIMLGTVSDESTRLSLCRSLPPIDTVINVQTEDTIEIIHRLTNGKGCDVFIDASGSASAIGMGASLVKKMGIVSGIGLTGKEKIEFPYNAFMMKSVKYFFNVSTKYESWDRAIHFISKGVIPCEQLITHKTSIEEWALVFSELKAQSTLKAVFVF